MSKLKGLILAAGRGTRLSPLTDNLTKALVPLGNRPLITYALDKLTEIGISDIGIVAGSNEAELRFALSSYAADLSYVQQTEPLGLAHAVNCARGFCGDSDFVLLFCDNLFAAGLHPSLQMWNSLKSTSISPVTAAMIHTYEMPDPRACGVAIVKDGWVQELEEKPAVPRSNLAVVGIDFFAPVIFEAISRIKPSKRGEYEITDAIAELITMGYGVKAQELPGFWFDTGTFRDLVAAHSDVLDCFGQFRIEGDLFASNLLETSGRPCRLGLGQNSTAHYCEFSGDVAVGRDCVLTNCRLGPAVSIADGCRLTGCNLSNVQVHADSLLTSISDSDCIYASGRRLPE